MAMFLDYFKSNPSLSVALTITFVSLGIILGLCIVIWTIMEIIAFFSRPKKRKHIKEEEVEATMSTSNGTTNDATIAAIIAAISVATRTPAYNLNIKSFKRSASNKW
ncbi:hypothetical protein FACS189425_07330 [Clostridia bacterium]|nr:hypothetical protein FACS189425_07330 [Clostridia bacterium]